MEWVIRSSALACLSAALLTSATARADHERFVLPGAPGAPSAVGAGGYNPAPLPPPVQGAYPARQGLGGYPTPQGLGGYPAPQGASGYPIPFEVETPAPYGQPYAPGGYVSQSATTTTIEQFGGVGGLGGVAACPPSLVVQADQLVAAVDAFLCAFGPIRCSVPQGECIYADALAVRQSALAVRQAAALGLPPCELRPIVAQLDAACCRFIRRIDAVACGRVGPNIQRAYLIAALCNQIRGLV